MKKSKKDLQKTAKIKTFINKCIWEGINPSSEKGDWKKIEKNKNNFLSMFCMLKKKKYILVRFQKISCEKQVILLMILN